MSQLPLFSSEPQPLPSLANRHRNDVRTGRSGEHLVLAKLTRWGFDAHDAPQDSAYDVIVDIAGKIIRVQVKTKSEPSGSSWSYRVQRGNWRSATGTYEYADGDYDVFAGVANSLERVIFVPRVVQSIRFTTQEFMEPDAGRRSWLASLKHVLETKR